MHFSHFLLPRFDIWFPLVTFEQRKGHADTSATNPMRLQPSVPPTVMSLQIPNSDTLTSSDAVSWCGVTPLLWLGPL